MAKLITSISIGFDKASEAQYSETHQPVCITQGSRISRQIGNPKTLAELRAASRPGVGRNGRRANVGSCLLWAGLRRSSLTMALQRRPRPALDDADYPECSTSG